MIRIVLMDIDGVLTNGKVTIDSSGNEYKTIDYQDIDAVFEMKRCGMKVGIITGESSPITLAFKERFKPDFFYPGCKDKVVALKEILAQTGAAPEEVCYIGDGTYDIAILKSVKVAACPANAIPEVRAVSNVRLNCSGGNGCISELFKLIIERNSPPGS